MGALLFIEVTLGKIFSSSNGETEDEERVLFIYSLRNADFGYKLIKSNVVNKLCNRVKCFTFYGINFFPPPR